MNILYLANHLNIGGVTRYILTLARGMKAKGHNVFIASGGGNLTSVFEKEGINHIPVPVHTKAEISFHVLASLLKLLPEVKKHNIDLIHANTRVTQVLACLLQKCGKKPYVSTCHGFFKRRLTRRIFPCWGKKVIAISIQVKEHLINDFKVQAENICLIHNGIDIEKFSKAYDPADIQEKKNNLGLGDSPVVGIIARLSDVKGHIYLIQAMQEVLQKIPQAKLLIVGEGKTKTDLEALARKLHIDQRVIFLATAPNTEEILAVMDLFVLPSLEEGLGLSLMEAMAASVAVIGSDVGGIKTLIQDNLTGLIVEPRDVRGLSEAIVELLSDRLKRKKLADSARIFIRENFAQEKMIDETERLYLECLNAGS